MKADTPKAGPADGAADDQMEHLASALDGVARLGLCLSEKLLVQFWEGPGGPPRSLDPIRSLLAHERTLREVRATMALRDQVRKSVARARRKQTGGAGRARP